MLHFIFLSGIVALHVAETILYVLFIVLRYKYHYKLHILADNLYLYVSIALAFITEGIFIIGDISLLNSIRHGLEISVLLLILRYFTNVIFVIIPRVYESRMLSKEKELFYQEGPILEDPPVDY